MAQSDPLVTVIVTHHLNENQKYLDHCLGAINSSVGVEFETIVLADTEIKPLVPDTVRLIHDRALDTATKKVHLGVQLANPKSQYFLFLSDDVIITKTMLANMVEGLGDNRMIINPMCNGDLGGRFIAPIPFPQSADYEDMDDRFDEINEYQTGLKLIVKQDWLSFYCTLIPRSVWEMVGELDPALETRHNDVDYCYRAQALGIPSVINFNAFAFHFGSKTLSKSVKPGEQDAATQAFKQKWGNR